MAILQRYFFREMALNFLGVTGALAAILSIYQLGAVLKRAAEYQYPRALVLRLFALGAAENFSLLLPLGGAKGGRWLTRAAAERTLGRPFLLPGDLEVLMPSFLGRFHVGGCYGFFLGAFARKLPRIDVNRA